jgi:N-acetyl-gamma-glutamyl-phosphate reductase
MDTQTASAPLRVGIVGASGYSGGELLRLLAPATSVHIARVTAHTQAGKLVEETHPFLSGVVPLTFSTFQPEDFTGMDCVFIALPAGESMEVVPALQGKVRRIIDLGGDLRLPTAEMYERYYKLPHTAPSLLGRAVYGLPELFREQIRSAEIVANPGCYPTGAILALLPAVKAGLIDTRGIVINSLSGVSGAGRSSKLEYSFSEVNESVRAYKIGAHQHIPEIRTTLERVADAPVTLSFIPHLVPMTRGIYTTVHADLKTDFTAEVVSAAYAEYYRNEPFVRVKSGIPEIRAVLYTNFCDVATFVEPHTGKLVVISAIDNLVKGAAGQAIQNMNIMFGLPEHHLLK